MERTEQLKFCNACINKTTHSELGTICGLTNELPTFTTFCDDFIEKKSTLDVAFEMEAADKKKSLNKGRNSLFFIGGLYVLVGVYEAFFMSGYQLIFGVVDWVIALIFIGLGVWSFYKSFVALVTGLALYILLIILFAIFDPTTIFKGIIFKGIIISFLFYAIKTAREEQALNKESKADLLDQL